MSLAHFSSGGPSGTPRHQGGRWGPSSKAPTFAQEDHGRARNVEFVHPTSSRRYGLVLMVCFYAPIFKVVSKLKISSTFLLFFFVKSPYFNANLIRTNEKLNMYVLCGTVFRFQYVHIPSALIVISLSSSYFFAAKLRFAPDISC